MEGRSFLSEKAVDFFTNRPDALDIFSAAIAADWRMFGTALDLDSSVLRNLACDSSEPRPVDKAKCVIMHNQNLKMYEIIHTLEALRWLLEKRTLEDVATKTEDITGPNKG